MAGLHVRRGDLVEVVIGREAKKRGKVLRVMRDKNRVLVEKLNLVKRHMRPTQKNPRGGIVEKEGSLHVSNVRVVCPKCDAPRRMGHRTEPNGKRVRVCRQCGEAVVSTAS